MTILHAVTLKRWGASSAIAALGVLALALATPSANAAAPAITPATGGGAVVSDRGSGATGTALAGPTLTEAAAGDIAVGTIVLTAPQGFRFDPTTTVTLTPTAIATCVDIGGGAGIARTASPTASTITFTVIRASTAACAVTFSGIKVQATAAAPFASGDLAVGGTSNTAGKAGALVVADVSGTFDRPPVFSSQGRLAFVVFNGGTVAQLHIALLASSGKGAWVQSSTGDFVLYIDGGPDFVNAPFMKAFPNGLPARAAITVTG